MRIVLVRPRDPNNIGAAARAMANFGLSDLVIVAPFEPTLLEARSAVGAESVLGSANVVPTLADAIADCTFVGATTSGSRRALDRVAMPDEFVSESLAFDRVALVFGNEKHGLKADEIRRCHVVVSIPTTREQPSMNLGQAVAVCCYEYTRARPLAPVAPTMPGGAANVLALEQLIEQVVPEPDIASEKAKCAGARNRLRAILLRARLANADVGLLRGLFAASVRPKR